MFSNGWTLALQSGRVSNFCHPIGPVIEPMDDYRFDRDPCGRLTRVRGGHPLWTGLELARETEIVSGCAVIQQPVLPTGRLKLNLKQNPKYAAIPRRQTRSLRNRCAHRRGWHGGSLPRKGHATRPRCCGKDSAGGIRERY